MRAMAACIFLCREGLYSRFVSVIYVTFITWRILPVKRRM
jgi:hypothetical protein